MYAANDIFIDRYLQFRFKAKVEVLGNTLTYIILYMTSYELLIARFVIISNLIEFGMDL